MIIIKPDGMLPEIRDVILEECKIFGEPALQKDFLFTGRFINFLYPKLLKPGCYYTLSNTLQYLYKKPGYLVIFKRDPEAQVLLNFKANIRKKFGNTIFGNCIHTPDPEEMQAQIKYFLSIEETCDDFSYSLNSILSGIDNKSKFYKAYSDIAKFRRLSRGDVLAYCENIYINSKISDDTLKDISGPVNWDSTFEDRINKVINKLKLKDASTAIALATYGVYGEI